MSKKFLRIFLVLAALFFVVRIIFFRQIADSALFQFLILDSDFYYNWARGLATGHGSPPGPFWLSPLYPFFLAGLFKAAGSVSVSLIMIVQFLLSLGTLVLLTLFTRKLFGDTVALVAAGLAVFYSPWLYYDGVILTASLILFLNSAILFLIVTRTDLIPPPTRSASEEDSPPPTPPVNGGETKSKWVWAAIGILTGLSALARPSVLIFAVLLMIVMVRRARISSFTFHVSSLVLFLGAILITLAPVLIRNWAVSGSPVLTTSSGGINFFIGNRAGATGMYDEFDFIRSFDPWREAEGFREEAVRRVGHELTLTQASRYWMGQALRDIATSPFEWLVLMVKKAWLTIQREELPTNLSFRGVAGFSPILGALPLRWGLLWPLAISGAFLIFRRQHPVRRLFVPYMAGYALTNVLFFSASEYRFPMILVLLPAAAYLLVSLWEMIELKQVKLLATVCGIYVLALVIANLPSQQVAIAAEPKGDYTNMGTVAVDYGMIAESIPLFARALTVDDTWRDARIGLAESLWKLGNFDDARREFQLAGVAPPDSISGEPLQSFLDEIYQHTEDDDYRGALEVLNRSFPPDHDAPTDVWNARAMIESELGHYDRAADALVKAGDREQDNPDWLYRAGVLAETGKDTARAEDLYRKAIERYAAYAPARLALGFTALRQHDLETAKTQLEELQKIRISADSTRRRVDELRRRIDVAEAEAAKP